MKYLFLAALLTATVAPSYAQNFEDYKTLLPTGLVPKDFTEQTSAKVASDINVLTAENARQRKTKKNSF
jgi:hypothetical protein